MGMVTQHQAPSPDRKMHLRNRSESKMQLQWSPHLIATISDAPLHKRPQRHAASAAAAPPPLPAFSFPSTSPGSNSYTAIPTPRPIIAPTAPTARSAQKGHRRQHALLTSSAPWSSTDRAAGIPPVPKIPEIYLNTPPSTPVTTPRIEKTGFEFFAPKPVSQHVRRPTVLRTTSATSTTSSCPILVADSSASNSPMTTPELEVWNPLEMHPVRVSVDLDNSLLNSSALPRHCSQLPPSPRLSYDDVVLQDYDSFASMVSQSLGIGHLASELDTEEEKDAEDEFWGCKGLPETFLVADSDDVVVPSVEDIPPHAHDDTNIKIPLTEEKRL